MDLKKEKLLKEERKKELPGLIFIWIIVSADQFL